MYVDFRDALGEVEARVLDGVDGDGLDAESMVVDPKVACPVAVLVTDPPSTSSWVTLCSAMKTHVSPTSSLPSLSASPES